STEPSITINGQPETTYNLTPIFTPEQPTEEPYTSAGNKLYVDGVTIREPSGNHIRLQGYNIEPRDMTEEGMIWLKNHGFNYLRVNIFWHRLEPQQGSYSSTYFGYLDDVLEWCEEYQIYANVVFMQWQWSPYFKYYSSGGGTGFPSWVVSGGGYEDSSTGLRDCIADFYMKRNNHGVWMREQFSEFWSYLINRYENNQYVAAYEIMNEPLIAKGVYHVNGVHNAVMDMYEECTQEFRSIDPETIIIYHDIGDGAERIVPYENIMWTRSWYNVMYGGYSSSEYSQIISRIQAIKTKYNTNLGTPFIISEMGFTLTDEQNGGATNWIRDSFDIMREVGLNNGYEQYGWFIYDEGTKYNFRTPRNSDGSNTWIVPILKEYV
ncbi:MAG: cellulase family glycosylhydrolase, partial [Candidatus Bathyarchaeota archaeon]